MASLRFLFDGRRINDEDTPKSLGMEDDDVGYFGVVHPLLLFIPGHRSLSRTVGRPLKSLSACVSTGLHRS